MSRTNLAVKYHVKLAINRGFFSLYRVRTTELRRFPSTTVAQHEPRAALFLIFWSPTPETNAARRTPTRCHWSIYSTARPFSASNGRDNATAHVS